MRLLAFCIASSFGRSEESQVICGFEIDPNDISQIKTKSTYDKRLAKDNTFKGLAFIILRLRKKGDGYQLEIVNLATDSIIYKDEAPNYLIEFAENKILATGYPSYNYIIHDW